MSAPAAPTTYTPEDLLRMPDRKRYELVNGELKELKTTVYPSYVAGTIFSFLHKCACDRHVWLFPEGTSFQCFANDRTKVRKPDTAAILRSRMTPIQIETMGHCRIVPDLAVEVISPNDLLYEVREKTNEWLEAGVRTVWEVNPKTKEVFVYRGDGSVNRYRGEEQLTADDISPGFRVTVSDLFRMPQATEGEAKA